MTTTPRRSRSLKPKAGIPPASVAQAILATLLTHACFMLATTPTFAAADSPAQHSKKKQPKSAKKPATKPRPLHERSTKEILAQYTFVGDFSEKSPERPVSDEVFWKYPLPLPKVDFPLDQAFDASKEMPASKGRGRATDHLNRGRALFLQGNLLEARNTWLTGRARYGKEYEFHRRNDYFIGQAFLNLGFKTMQTESKSYEDKEIRPFFANAATFYAWAFINKVDIQDSFVDQVMPKGLYNLAAIYWKYDRFAGAFGAADRGLNFLRKTGRKDFRPQLNRVQAEAFIKNGSHLEAVQALDKTIRQDPLPNQAAAAFARVGDIYFDLNNYELAEDAYALGSRVDEELKQMNPAQLVLRGESLFWLGKFSEAQTMFHFALHGSSFRKVTTALPPSYAPWAALRLADSYLARKELDKAKLEYYRVSHNYTGTLAARIANVREACLDLPFYQGQNIKHARELLEQEKQLSTPPEPVATDKTTDKKTATDKQPADKQPATTDTDPAVQAVADGERMPAPAIELGWACQVGSYTDRERTPEMLDRVKAFYAIYPESRFLQSFIEPVREFQASHLAPLFKAGEIYKATDFFEKTRKNLFPRVPDDIAAQLFVAYADTARSPSAAEFWSAYTKEPDTDMKVLRQVVVASELIANKDAIDKETVEKKPKTKTFPQAKNWTRSLEKDLKRSWRLPPSPLALNYVMRLLQTPQSSQHYAWLQRLAQTWSVVDPAYTCDLEYPLLSRMLEAEPAQAKFVLERTGTLIDKNLPELFKHDESCALSLLELEAKLLRKDTQALAARYLKRQDWPLQGAFLHLYWTIAEHLNDDGDRKSATNMWQVVRDKGTAGSPEVQFAKTRLDKSKTELEKLWD